MKPTVLAGCALLLAVMAVTGTAASANQGTNPPRWWKSDPHRRELNLTSEQSRKIEDIFQQAASTQRQLIKAIDDAEAEFEKLVDVEKVDDAAVIDQINRVVSARADLMRSHSMMLFRMRRVLTPEQWKKLGEITEREKKAADKGK
jgi:Spy/CpxP family protein refolding chaperone